MHSIILTILLAITLPHLLKPPSTPTSHPPPPDPSYKLPSSPNPICAQPPYLHQRPPLHQPCPNLHLLSSTPTTLSLLLTPSSSQPNPQNHTIHLTIPSCPHHPPIATATLPNTIPTPLTYTIRNLHPDTDYILELRTHPTPILKCRATLSTPSTPQNHFRNPGFESISDPPFLATRFRFAHDASPRHWTPFYNGQARRVCGIVPLSHSTFLAPRSGRCCLQLGIAPTATGPLSQHHLFHGVHQGVAFGPTGIHHLVLSIWYRVAHIRFLDQQESPRDAVAVVLAWRLDDGTDDDGIVVPLAVEGRAVREWTSVCVAVTAPRGRRIVAAHVFFHLHDVLEGRLFVDDVEMREGQGGNGFGEGCYSDPRGGQRQGERKREREETVETHLCAEQRPTKRQLTLAVPLTANRVLRLEAMARLYGGGPVVAAVLVKSELEMKQFCAVWWRKGWLRRHVDVTFVRQDRGDGEMLEINALRNVAVLAARTDFVLMVDVDMTPATRAFACLRDGDWLERLLPKGERRLLTLPVFIGDVHHRAARDKMELNNLLVRRVGTSYCLNSQRSNKIKRWYKENSVTETRFLTDYEPYGIVRRDEYPEYDERFSGYGFNKISWAYGAQLGGWRLFVLPEAFLTHLNHVENEWVQAICVPHYIKTWRRFLAFVSESAPLGGVVGAGRLRERNDAGDVCVAQSGNWSAYEGT